jgi:prophage regulatory protein
MIDTDRIYRLPEVRERIGGLSRSWVYLAVAQGRFPPPIRLGAYSVGWRHKDIEAFLSSRPTGIGVGPRSRPVQA